jgi:hypothetical protein
MQLLHKLDRFQVFPTGKKRLGQFRCPACNAVVVRILYNGQKQQACGCQQREGVSNANFKHGESGHPLYSIWSNMRRRCRASNRPSYPRYGGRGIKVCEQWSDFAAFLQWAIDHGWSLGLCLDRADNNGHYTPDNCRFVTHQVNNQNRRTCKLTTTTVLAIRQQLASGVSQRSIARKFGVSCTTVCRIARNRAWRNILS